MLSIRSLHCAAILPSNSYYMVVASIFLVSTVSVKQYMGSISQNFRQFSAILAKVTPLLMPHVLIKYAHVLICISAGEGFVQFHFEVI